MSRYNCGHWCSVCVGPGSGFNYYYVSLSVGALPHQLQSVLRLVNLPHDLWPVLPTVKWIGVGKSRESMIQLFWEGSPTTERSQRPDHLYPLTPFSPLPLFLDFSYFYGVSCCGLNEKRLLPCSRDMWLYHGGPRSVPPSGNKTLSGTRGVEVRRVAHQPMPFLFWSHVFSWGGGFCTAKYLFRLLTSVLIGWW